MATRDEKVARYAVHATSWCGVLCGHPSALLEQRMCGRVRARVLRQADFCARGAEPWTLARRLPLAATPGRRDLSAACRRAPVRGRQATPAQRGYFLRSSFAIAMPAAGRYTDLGPYPTPGFIG